MGGTGQGEFSISEAASMLGLHPRTLRNYEKAGLVTPSRRRQWRYYTLTDIAWIKCLFAMVHRHGINISSVRKLLTYAPCWEIADCPRPKRLKCSVYKERLSGE